MKLFSDFEYFDPMEMEYKWMYQMFEIVTKELGQKAIVVESDDLMRNPGMLIVSYNN